MQLKNNIKLKLYHNYVTWLHNFTDWKEASPSSASLCQNPARTPWLLLENQAPHITVFGLMSFYKLFKFNLNIAVFENFKNFFVLHLGFYRCNNNQDQNPTLVIYRGKRKKKVESNRDRNRHRLIYKM